MAKRKETRSQDDRDVNQRFLPVREAVHIAADYLTAITGRQPTQITGLTPSDEEGWIVEVEVVEDRRIPSSADMLALYEIELDADGELLAHQRTHRYMRGNDLSPMQDDKWTVDGDANSGPT
jgi:Gas vesicle synthesis protein GvpO